MDDRTMTPRRNVTPERGATARRDSTPQSTPPDGSWEAFRGVGDPRQKYSIWRLCLCPECDGTGKGAFNVIGTLGPNYVTDGKRERCPECRGEGKQKQLLATCGTAAAMGVTIETLAEEGEFEGCPIGILKDGKWLVLPWLPSARNASDAGRVLRQRRDIESRVTQERNTQ